MRFLIISIAIAILCSPRVSAQLLRQGEHISMDLGRDMEPDIEMGIWVTFQDQGDPNDADYWWRYLVASGLVIDREYGRFLLSPSRSRVHLEGDDLSLSLAVHQPSFGAAFYNELGVLNYHWWHEKGGIIRYISGADIFPGQLTCIVAFKFEDWDGWHVGWVRFRRASPNLGIAAYYDGMGYNPFPGKPIRAGFPPELPPVRTTVVNDGRSLHLAWESGYPGLKLLATPDLAPPVQWTPVDLASETEAVVELPTEGQLFFKLVHEP